jgi:hypothetical protein
MCPKTARLFHKNLKLETFMETKTDKILFGDQPYKFTAEALNFSSKFMWLIVQEV